MADYISVIADKRELKEKNKLLVKENKRINALLIGQENVRAHVLRSKKALDAFAKVFEDIPKLSDSSQSSMEWERTSKYNKENYKSKDDTTKNKFEVINMKSK